MLVRSQPAEHHEVMPAAEQSSQSEKVADLWRFYDEHATQARQHENLRATVTSILTGFAAVLVGFASAGGLDSSDVPAGLLVTGIGLLGALLSLKHYERNRFHVQVLGVVRREIGTLRGEEEPITQTLRTAAEDDHRRDFSKKVMGGSLIEGVSLYQLWVWLDLVVAAVGVWIVVGSVS